MDPQQALDRVTRAILAAFPDRAEVMLDVVERAFRRSQPLPAGGRECAMCGRGQIAWFALVALDPQASHSLGPSAIDERVLWQRPPRDDVAPPATVACLDCLMLARAELSSDPPSARVDRVLLDALRAVRASGSDDAEIAAREVEAAFADLRAPQRARAACAICGATRPCVQGPAGGALCAVCSSDHWRWVASDPLTRVEPRTIFAARMHFAIERTRRAGRPLALMLLDVDHMKSFNDIQSLPAGDALLMRIPEVLRPSLAPGDPHCRYGGEEFAVLLPGRTVSEAVRIGEEIRARAAAELRPPGLPTYPIEATRVDLSGRPHFPNGRVTVSIGIAGLQPDANALDLVRFADERLGDAKRSGRNRVCA